MAATLDSTPAADGWRMPAEFAPHAGCWMAWPERPDTWRLDAGPAQEAFAAVASAIAEVEPVTMTASPAQAERARAALPPGVEVVELATDDAWMRDIGPTFVTDAKGQRRGVDWEFNAWGGLEGGLYAPWDRDDAAAAAICEREQVPRYRAPLVLCYDGSDESKLAIHEAARLFPGARVKVIHVWQSIQSSAAYRYSAAGVTGALTEAMDELEASGREAATKIVQEGVRLASEEGLTARLSRAVRDG